MSLGKPSSIYIQALLACSSPVVLMCLVLLLAAMTPTKQGRCKAGAFRCAGIFSFVSSGHYRFQSSLYTWHEDFIIFAELCTAEGSAQILYLLALCSKILSFGGKLFFRLVQSLHIFVRYSPEPHWKLKWLPAFQNWWPFIFCSCKDWDSSNTESQLYLNICIFINSLVSELFPKQSSSSRTKRSIIYSEVLECK